MIKGKGNSGVGVRKISSNIRGLGAHPAQHSAVKNAPPHPSQLGRDGFHEGNKRTGAPVVKGQGKV